jgi:N-acetylneuraminic acid mutarotase
MTLTKHGIAIRYWTPLRGLASALLVTACGHDQGPQEKCIADCWTAQAPMLTLRESFGVGAVNGILYTVGGALPLASPHSAVATVEAYDPATDHWTARAPMPTARGGARVAAANGLLYAVGGTPAGQVDPLPAGTVEAYDPTTNTWTTRQPIPAPPFGAGVGVVNGILYAVGGVAPSSSGVVVTGTLQAYDPIADTWTTKAAMPTPRLGFGVGVVNGILYTVGGDAAGTTEAYDPLTDTWATRQPMLTPRLELDVGVVNGILYAAGGTTGNNADGIPTIVNTLEAYDPATNTWTTKTPMITGRMGLGVAVLNGAVYAIGGRPASPGDITGANEAYHP